MSAEDERKHRASEDEAPTGVDPSEVLFEEPGDEAEPELVSLTIGDGGERLDKWLAAQLPDRSRAEVQRWIEAGLVTRRGRALKASYRLTEGETIDVLIPAPENYEAEPEDIPLDILYEDADVLVIDKPAGMVVHPAAGHWRGTLVNAVLFHSPDLEGVGGARRPGIVHRLDKDTSGVILVAKNDAAHRNLQAQFRNREVEKTYLALVYGGLEPGRGEINAAVGRDPRDRKRMGVVPASQGRPATTRYETVSIHRIQTTSERLTLLACRPLTGRTHQIRVHLSHIHHPIVGDEVYGPRRKLPFACPRQFLHAERLRFRLPSSGQVVEFSAPLPADLQAILKAVQL
jgi:23S rRNA pseudouridine1911/1915/1917 synthase